MNINSLFLMIKLMWRYRCLCYEWRLKQIKYLINKIDLRSSLAAHTHFWSRGISFKRPSGNNSSVIFWNLMLFLWSSTATQSEYISGKCPSISFRNILWYVFLRLELMFVVTMVEALSWRQKKICEKWREIFTSVKFSLFIFSFLLVLFFYVLSLYKTMKNNMLSVLFVYYFI